VIAGAADEVVEPCALAAEDEDAVAGEVELVVVGCAPLVESDNPEILALEIFESANEVNDAGDAQVLGGAGAGLDGDRAEGRGAALGEDDAIHARAVGYAEKSAEVLRVFNAVEGKQETGEAGFSCGIGRKEVFNGERFLRVNEGDHALVRDVFGDECELLTQLLADSDATLAAESDELFDSGIVALGGDQDVVKAATSGLESFFHRMQTVENFHEG
jgi:hypothetical protein